MQPGPAGKTCVSYSSVTTHGIFVSPRVAACYLIFPANITLNNSPGVGGACRLDGVDPELVSDVFQPLQGLLVGFVVACHGFWIIS